MSEAPSRDAYILGEAPGKTEAPLPEPQSSGLARWPPKPMMMLFLPEVPAVNMKRETGLRIVTGAASNR